MAKKKSKQKLSNSSLQQPGLAAKQAIGNPDLLNANKTSKWIYAGLALLSFFLFANTLGHQYVLDDRLSMEGNELVKKGISSIPDLLSNHYRAGTESAKASALLYRPLSLISFAIEWSIAPGKPFIGHFFNVCWFAATVVLLYAALRRLFYKYHWFWAMGTTLLFAVHPIHTEVVANIKSRDELLNVFFSMASLYCCTRWFSEEGKKWLWAGMVCYFLALLSKESAVSFLPVLPLAGWFFYRKNFSYCVKTLLLFAVPVIIFLLMRQAVLSKEDGEYTVNEFDNAIVGAQSIAEKVSTSFMIFWKYVQLMVWPHPLISDYSYNYLQLAHPGNWQSIAGLILFAVLTVYSLPGLIKRKAFAFCCIAFLSSVILYIQLLMVIGTMFGERLMYMPSVWFCSGIVYLLMRLFKLSSTEKMFVVSRPHAKLIFPFALVILIYSLVTIRRNNDWKDDITLFTADVEKAPNSIRLLNGQAGEWYNTIYQNPSITAEEKNNLLAKIEENSRRALTIKPNPVSYYNLGNVANTRQQFDSAINLYNKAIALASNFKPALRNAQVSLVNLARSEANKKNFSYAATLFEKVNMDELKDAGIYLDFGTVYGNMGQPEKAILQFEKAAALAPQNKLIWKNLSIAYRAVGNESKAKECEAKAGL